MSKRQIQMQNADASTQLPSPEDVERGDATPPYCTAAALSACAGIHASESFEGGLGI